LKLDLVWQEFLKIINEEAGSRIVETWFKVVTLSEWNPDVRTVYLKVPNAFVREWLLKNYLPLIKTHLGRLLNESDLSVIFLDQTKSELTVLPPKLAVVENNFLGNSNIVVNLNTITPVARNGEKYPKGGLNQIYQFDTFVVGPNNSLAVAAAQAVADKPGFLYNPLFIYGNSGLGKTHLLYAIANHIKRTNANLRVLYQSADRFVNEFINAIRFDRIVAFEEKYKNVDVLLIDDIQFISNKEQTQEAFFHIFNSLYEARKQIVFSSDSLPKDIQGLAQRLKSRLDSGLVTDIQKPSLEIKIAIIKKKADFHQQPLPDDVAHYIASKSSANIRELEGLLIRLFAFSSLTKQPISLELAHKILLKTEKDAEPKKSKSDLNKIAKKVSAYYNCNLNELKSRCRLKSITLARHVAMYLMKKYTDLSLIDIGFFFKRKDHSTVIHAIEKIENFKSLDSKFNKDLEKIEHELS